MKHLVKLADLAPRQYDEVVVLLRENRIVFRETLGSFLGSGAILVADQDFLAAQALLREESREFAEGARERWEREWQTEHKSSAVRWFLHRAHQRPGETVAQLILLIIMVAIFVVYPVWYVLRAAI